MDLLDDRLDLLSYKSDCLFCKNFDPLYLTCSAFPDGIPSTLLQCREHHREIRADQEGNSVYEPDMR